MAVNPGSDAEKRRSGVSTDAIPETREAPETKLERSAGRTSTDRTSGRRRTIRAGKRSSARRRAVRCS
jgi:hypothetical protein